MVVMKTLKFVMYLFYRYYSKGGTKRIPYFSALCAVVFLIYILLFQILIIINKVDLLQIEKEDLRIEKYGKLALLFLPVFLIVAYLVKPNDLRNAVYSEDKIRRGGIFLTVYVISSVLILFLLIFATTIK